MYTTDQILPAENEYEIARDEAGYVSTPYRLVNPKGPLELPVGYEADGVNYKDAAIVPMGGDEEDLLGNAKTRDPMIQVVANCTVKLGPIELPYGERNPDQRAQMINAIKSLTIMDLTFLLIAIRVRSFRDGAMYRFTITCPNKACKQRRQTHGVDLTSLTINPAPFGFKRLGEFMLQDAGKLVRFQATKASEVDRIMALVRQNEASGPSAGLFAGIIDVGGQKLASYADTKKWSIADRDELRGAMQDINRYGHDLTIDVDDCPGCGTTMDLELDIGPSFFRPTAIR